MIIIIDNYDSFTYNVYQYFAKLGHNVVVLRNDSVNLQDVLNFQPTRIVLSPGPGHPRTSGCCLDIIKANLKIPVLGICLGHQAIALVYGAKITHANRIMHGKVSMIHHNHTGIFRELPSPYYVARYHSLSIDRASLPKCFEITAWTSAEHDNEIMAIQHKTLPLTGIQFHPEAIQTEYGYEILDNFTKDWH
jgi:anthranilate synthase/aminodeoxychorismate synthase-like glutamine amidotransferase